jgi:hypothetical protein
MLPISDGVVMPIEPLRKHRDVQEPLQELHSVLAAAAMPGSGIARPDFCQPYKSMAFQD